MTTDRLDRVENDLETVKELLISAARYAESSNRKAEQNDVRIGVLLDKADRTDAQIAAMRENAERTNRRVDEFVVQSQRLLTQHAERLDRVEAMIERLDRTVERLDRNFEASQAELREFRLTTNAALDRIDRILDYLMKQSGGNR